MSEMKEKSIRRISENWKFLKLEEISKVDTGGNAPQGEKYFRSGKYPFIRVQHFDGNKVHVDRWDLINDEAVKDYNLKLFLKDSIIFPKSGASINLEKRAMLPLDSYIVNHLCVITPNPKVAEPKFLFYALKKISFSKDSAGTTLPYLNLSYISKISIPLPSLPEQQRVAEVLGTVDEGIQKADEKIKTTERLKQGLMQKLLTEGIGHKEFKESEIGRIPKPWSVTEFEKAGIFQYGYTASATENDTGVKFLRITDIKEDGSVNWDTVPYCDIDSNYYKQYELKEGDILFARIGASAGKTSFIERKIKGIFASYLIRFQAFEEFFPKFVFYLTQSNVYWAQAIRQREGQLKKGLNATMLSALKLLKPPVPEQRKIVEILSSVDEKLELERKRKEKLETIKKGLMDDLLTGKRRVKW